MDRDEDCILLRGKLKKISLRGNIHETRRPEIVSEPKTENDADAYQPDSICLTCSYFLCFFFNLCPS